MEIVSPGIANFLVGGAAGNLTEPAPLRFSRTINADATIIAMVAIVSSAVRHAALRGALATL
jgi:hypothetical protein